jgi:hypothetical protein
MCKPPDFLILGTMRGGTTSLYVYLKEHPGVVGALRKEIHFFDLNYSRGWQWYLSHFPLRGSRAFLTGESSPNYLYYAESVGRIVYTLPEAKFIALLRNPIDRAYSHYQHEVAMGFETLSFENALRRECDTEVDPWQLRDLSERGIYYRDHFSYLSRGIYVTQLKRWMEKVSRDRLLILKSESFFNDPAAVLSQVLDFLGLPPSNRKTFKKWNQEQYEPMSEATRAHLRLFFKPHNDELSHLLNTDFQEWV